MFTLLECYSCRRQFQSHPGESRTHCTFCHVATNTPPHNLPHAPPPHYPHYPHALPLPSSYFPQALPSHSRETLHHAPTFPSPNYPHAPPPQFPHYLNAPLSVCQHSSQAQPAHAHVSFHHAPSDAVRVVHGRKKAVIVGVTYKHTEWELKGCINDANNMKDMLIKRFAFPESCIRMLNESEESKNSPTRENIRKAMQWLVQDSQSGDSLVFYFSGHGDYQKNHAGDEKDGYDETLLPMDHSTAGMLVDDEINATLVKPLPTGVKLHAIIDACHSGTVLDLPYLCRMDRSGEYTWEDHRPPSGTWTGSNGGEVFCFTSCDDDETSSDTMMLSKTMYTGAMTFAFIQSIQRGHGTKYGSLLNAMRSRLREVYDAEKSSSSSSSSSLPSSIVKRIDSQGDLATTPLGKLIARKHPNSTCTEKEQVPQLSANQKFNIYEKQFSM